MNSDHLRDVFGAAGSFIRARLRKLNCKANREVKAGKECHEMLLTRQDRAAYLADQHAAALRQFDELIEAARNVDALSIQSQAHQRLRDALNGNGGES